MVSGNDSAAQTRRAPGLRHPRYAHALMLAAITLLSAALHAHAATSAPMIGSSVFSPATLYMPLVEVPCPTICGAVRIENGGLCCIGGPPGATIAIPVSFAASSAFGAVASMRTDNQQCSSTSSLEQATWEPFVASRTYTRTLPVGWSSFAVRAQYRDTAGTVTPIACAEVALEGYEPPPPAP